MKLAVPPPTKTLPPSTLPPLPPAPPSFLATPVGVPASPPRPPRLPTRMFALARGVVALVEPPPNVLLTTVRDV